MLKNKINLYVCLMLLFVPILSNAVQVIKPIRLYGTNNETDDSNSDIVCDIKKKKSLKERVFKWALYVGCAIITVYVLKVCRNSVQDYIKGINNMIPGGHQIRPREDVFNPYEHLGLDENCNRSDIQRAYKKRAFETHPDKVGGNGEAFKDVQRSFEILNKYREIYDSGVLHRSPVLFTPEEAAEALSQCPDNIRSIVLREGWIVKSANL